MEESNINEMLKPHLSSIRTPGAGDKVFKDECAYSFDSPVDEQFVESMLCLLPLCQIFAWQNICIGLTLDVKIFYFYLFSGIRDRIVCLPQHFCWIW